MWKYTQSRKWSIVYGKTSFLQPILYLRQYSDTRTEIEQNSVISALLYVEIKFGDWNVASFTCICKATQIIHTQTVKKKNVVYGESVTFKGLQRSLFSSGQPIMSSWFFFVGWSCHVCGSSCCDIHLLICLRFLWIFEHLNIRNESSERTRVFVLRQECFYEGVRVFNGLK